MQNLQPAVERVFESAPLTAAERLSQLVSESAFVAAQELLNNLDAEELSYLVEQVRLLLRTQGVESPAWQHLSYYELHKIASGAFHIQSGKVILLGEA
jgi:hypothetical protein